jgi:hypothetical protein
MMDQGVTDVRARRISILEIIEYLEEVAKILQGKLTLTLTPNPTSNP